MLFICFPLRFVFSKNILNDLSGNATKGLAEQCNEMTIFWLEKLKITVIIIHFKNRQVSAKTRIKTDHSCFTFRSAVQSISD